jgi:hypothetical protein
LLEEGRRNHKAAATLPARNGKVQSMARKTSKSASKDVESAMRRRKKGTLKSGSGRKVKSKKQAIAIGLSEARRKGKKVAKKPKRSAKKSSKKKS